MGRRGVMSGLGWSVLLVDVHGSVVVASVVHEWSADADGCVLDDEVLMEVRGKDRQATTFL
jgi:hypothetical protein